ADRPRQGDRQHAGGQRYAGAVEEPGEEVTPEAIGAEWMLPRAVRAPDRRGEARPEVLRVRVGRARDPREDGDGDEGDADRQGKERRAARGARLAQRASSAGRR